METILEYLKNLVSQPEKLAGLIAAILVGILALINIGVFFRPSARFKRKTARMNYLANKKLMKNHQQELKQQQQQTKADLLSANKGLKTSYKDDLIELSSSKNKVNLSFKLPKNTNSSFAQELTNAYLHAQKLIENGTAKLKIK